METYKKKLAEFDEQLKNYENFDYDAEADELFRLQRQQLERNQRDGVSDVLAQYAANTGMGGSSAAMSAAQQTASKYNSMIADALTAAEEKAYSRWAAEKAELESKIASTKQDAYSEAATRFSLGDLSGYQGLGFDTSVYEEDKQRQIALEEAARKAALGDYSGYKDLGYDTSIQEKKIEDEAAAAKIAAEQSAYQAKLADAQLRAQYGDLSGIKALGIDTSVYEAQQAANAEASKEEIGINGTTKSQYDAQMDRWLQIYKSSDDEETKARALEEMDALYKGYYGQYTPAEIESNPVISWTEADGLLDQAESNGKKLSAENYKKLVAYFYRNPIETEEGQVYRGEDVLYLYGITMSQTPTGYVHTVFDDFDTTHGFGDDV